MANSHSISYAGSGNLLIPTQSYINFGSGSYTISFWFKRNGHPGASERLMGKSSGNNWAISGRVSTNGTLNFQQWNGTTNPSWSTTTDVCDNAWHYVVVVLNDSGTNRVFVDGNAEGTDTHLAITTATNFFFYDGPDGAQSGTHEYDEIIIYNVALSNSLTFNRRYDDPVVEGYASLQGYYNLNNTANDSSSNANNATNSSGSFTTDVPFVGYGKNVPLRGLMGVGA